MKKISTLYTYPKKTIHKSREKQKTNRATTLNCFFPLVILECCSRPAWALRSIHPERRKYRWDYDQILPMSCGLEVQLKHPSNLISLDNIFPLILSIIKSLAAGTIKTLCYSYQNNYAGLEIYIPFPSFVGTK